MISSAAIEQSSGVEEISKNIESVASVSKESAMEAQDLANNADQVSHVVGEIQMQINRFTVK